MEQTQKANQLDMDWPLNQDPRNIFELIPNLEQLLLLRSWTERFAIKLISVDFTLAV